MVRESELNCVLSLFKYRNSCYSVLTMKQLLWEALYLSLNKWKLNEHVNIGGVHINVYPLWSCQCDSADVGYLMPTKLYCNSTCHYDVYTIKISNLIESINDAIWTVWNFFCKEMWLLLRPVEICLIFLPFFKFLHHRGRVLNCCSLS